MRTNFQMLKELKDWYPAERGFISGDEMEFLGRELELGARPIVGLRNLRDFVVCFFNRKGIEYSGYEEERRELDKLSAICGVIDHELWSRGEEV